VVYTSSGRKARSWYRGRRERSGGCLCTGFGGRLEVGCCVGASAGVVVLLEVRLERRGTSVVALVTESGAGAGHEVVVVLGDAALALLHAPENKSNTAEEESTTDTSNNTTDDLLVALAQTAAAAATVAVLGLRWVGHGCLAGGGDGCARACRGDLGSLAVDDGAEDSGVDADRGRDKRGGADNGSGPDGSGPDGRGACRCLGC